MKLRVVSVGDPRNRVRFARLARLAAADLRLRPDIAEALASRFEELAIADGFALVRYREAKH